MKGFEIKENVLSMVVCSGCFDLFHLCQGQQSVTQDHVCKASGFFHLPLLVFMIENGADINVNDEYSWTPFHLAAWNGHLCVVEYLVNQQADVNARVSLFNETPLNLAAENGHLSVVEYLVNSKADVNARASLFMVTPLHLAAKNGHLSVVEFLVNQKTDIYAKDHHVEF